MNFIKVLANGIPKFTAKLYFAATNTTETKASIRNCEEKIFRNQCKISLKKKTQS